MQETEGTMKETFKELNDALMNSGGTLRRDMNKYMKEASETRKQSVSITQLSTMPPRRHPTMQGTDRIQLKRIAQSYRDIIGRLHEGPRKLLSRRRVAAQAVVTPGTAQQLQKTAITRKIMERAKPTRTRTRSCRSSRGKEHKNVGLSSIIPPNRLYDRLMSYRYYSLDPTVVFT